MRPGDRVRILGKSDDLLIERRGDGWWLVQTPLGRYYFPAAYLTLITPESTVPTPSLAWFDHDGELTLSLWLGGLCIEVATIYAADNQVSIWGWKRYRDLLQFECRNRAEAIAVVRALIGYRCGGEVPDVE